MRRVMLIVISIVTLLTAVTPTNVLAQSPSIIEHMELKTSGVFWDDCYGEEISFQLDEELTIWLMESKADGYTWRLQFLSHGTAEGLSTGATYQLHGTNNWTVQGAPGGTHTLHFQGESAWVSQGSTNNVIFSLIVHLTRTPDGEWSAEVERGEPRCLG